MRPASEKFSEKMNLTSASEVENIVTRQVTQSCNGVAINTAWYILRLFSNPASSFANTNYNQSLEAPTDKCTFGNHDSSTGVANT